MGLGSTSRADPIFVGVKDQSRVFFNNLRIYWLADRPLGVRRFQLETQVATEAAVQREQIADLVENRVNWLVIDTLQVAGDMAFWKRRYQGSTEFDDYVSTHYVEAARFGRFAVLRRAMMQSAAAETGKRGPKGLSLPRSIR